MEGQIAGPLKAETAFHSPLPPSVCACSVASVVTGTLRPQGLQPARLLCPWDTLGKREYWSGLSCLPPGDLPDPGIEPASLMSPALAGGFFTTQVTQGNAAAAAAKSLQSCPTLCDPIRRQPTRLPCPWDSPGKNTGVGRHFLLQCMHACKVASVMSQGNGKN